MKGEARMGICAGICPVARYQCRTGGAAAVRQGPSETAILPETPRHPGVPVTFAARTVASPLNTSLSGSP